MHLYQYSRLHTNTVDFTQTPRLHTCGSLTTRHNALLTTKAACSQHNSTPQTILDSTLDLKLGERKVANSKYLSTLSTSLAVICADALQIHEVVPQHSVDWL
jgi:hypothetical protein